MQIKRILHIIGKMDRAGAETMVMNLYRSIDRNQFQFDFVSFSKDNGDFDYEILAMGGKIFNIELSNPIQRMLALKKLLINHPEYQIVHCHTLFSNAFHLLAAHLAKVPNRIVHSHNTSDQSKSKLISTLYQNFSRRLIKKYATNYISCGVAASNFLFPNEKKVLFLSNAVDTNYFANMGETKTSYITDNFDLKDDCLKIIQVGRLQEVKNPFFSIKIATELKRRGIDFKFIFIGKGELSEALNKEIKSLSLSENIVLAGLRSDIPELMAGADIMVMPSLHEGFPVVLVEAQSAGLKCLISDSISSEVNLNVDLVEFESLTSSVEKWVDKLLELRLKKKIEKNNRLKKMSDFDVNQNVIKLRDLYNFIS